MVHPGVRSTPETAGRDDQLRHFSKAARRFRRSAVLAGVAKAARGHSARSRIAMRPRRRCARPHSCLSRRPTDRHANRSDKPVARKHSRSRNPARMRVPERARVVFGMWLAGRSCGCRRAASSSREALHCGLASARARRSARSGCAPQYESIASRGVGGTNGRPSARDKTADGKMRGKALVRRASERRFRSSFSSCHLDIIGPREIDGMMPSCRKAFVTKGPALHGQPKRRKSCPHSRATIVAHQLACTPAAASYDHHCNSFTWISSNSIQTRVGKGITVC